MGLLCSYCLAFTKPVHYTHLTTVSSTESINYILCPKNFDWKNNNIFSLMTNIGQQRSYFHFTKVYWLFANDFSPIFMKTTNEKTQFSIVVFIKFRPKIHASSIIPHIFLVWFIMPWFPAQTVSLFLWHGLWELTHHLWREAQEAFWRRILVNCLSHSDLAISRYAEEKQYFCGQYIERKKWISYSNRNERTSSCISMSAIPLLSSSCMLEMAALFPGTL